MPLIMRQKNSIKILLFSAILLASCYAQTPEPTLRPLKATLQVTPTIAITSTPPPSVTPTRITETPTATPIPELPLFTDDHIRDQVNRLAVEFMTTTKNPGLSVAIIKRNQQTGQLEALLLNYGTVSKGGGRPINSNTVYEIGSITKLFTGTLLAEDVNSGEMKLNDPIQNYLPSGIQAPNYNGVPITLDELATHRSGLPRDLASDNLPDLYTWLNTYQLIHKPGSEYIYSNLGYSLLGDILARHANMDYGTLVFQSVSQPLGLLDTTEVLSTDQMNRLAQGYDYNGLLAPYFPNSGAMSSAGYLHSTLNDLTRFLIDNMQPDSTTLNASLTLAQTMQAEGRNQGTGTALGWEINRPGESDERVWKGGVTNGFSSYVSFARDDNSGFVLLTNGQYVDNLVNAMTFLLKEGN